MLAVTVLLILEVPLLFPTFNHLVFILSSFLKNGFKVLVYVYLMHAIVQGNKEEVRKRIYRGKSGHPRFWEGLSYDLNISQIVYLAVYRKQIDRFTTKFTD